MKPNTLLFTKDGTQIGNAIVVENVCGKHTILTDYGFVARNLIKAELSDLFTFGTTPETRRTDVWPWNSSSTHKHYTRRGRCKTCGFHGCRILVNQDRECVDCYTTAAQ